MLFEHGMLQYKLDDSDLCIAQGGTDLNQICGIDDGYAETGHKNSIKIMMAPAGGNPDLPDRNFDSTLYIKTDDREDYHAWKRVLKDFLTEKQKEIKHKRRKANLANKLRSQTQDIVPTYETELSSKTLPKNFQTRTTNFTEATNAIIRCKSESNGSEYDKIRFGCVPNTNNTNNSGNSAGLELGEVLSAGGDGSKEEPPPLINGMSQEMNNYLFGTGDSPIRKSITSNSGLEEDSDRARGRAERRAKAFRENRRNSELHKTETAPTLNYGQNHSTPGMVNLRNYANTPSSPDRNHSNVLPRTEPRVSRSLGNNPSTERTIGGSSSLKERQKPNFSRISTAVVTGYSREPNSSTNGTPTASSIRRTKSLDRRAYNDNRFSKFGRLFIMVDKNQTKEPNVAFAVLKPDTLTFFKDEAKALISKHQTEYVMQIDLKQAVRVVYVEASPGAGTTSQSQQPYYDFTIEMQGEQKDYILAAQTNGIRRSWVSEIQKTIENLLEEASDKSSTKMSSNRDLLERTPNTLSGDRSTSSRGSITIGHLVGPSITPTTSLLKGRDPPTKTKIQAVSPTPQNPVDRERRERERERERAERERSRDTFTNTTVTTSSLITSERPNRIEQITPTMTPTTRYNPKSHLRRNTPKREDRLDRNRRAKTIDVGDASRNYTSITNNSFTSNKIQKVNRLYQDGSANISNYEQEKENTRPDNIGLNGRSISHQSSTGHGVQGIALDNFGNISNLSNRGDRDDRTSDRPRLNHNSQPTVRHVKTPQIVQVKPNPIITSPISSGPSHRTSPMRPNPTINVLKNVSNNATDMGDSVFVLPHSINSASIGGFLMENQVSYNLFGVRYRINDH